MKFLVKSRKQSGLSLILGLAIAPLFVSQNALAANVWHYNKTVTNVTYSTEATGGAPSVAIMVQEQEGVCNHTGLGYYASPRSGNSNDAVKAQIVSNIALAAFLSGKKVDIWHDNVGSVCTIVYIRIKN